MNSAVIGNPFIFDTLKDAAVFGKPEPSVQELVTACVVRKEGAEVRIIMRYWLAGASYMPHIYLNICREVSMLAMRMKQQSYLCVQMFFIRYEKSRDQYT